MIEPNSSSTRPRNPSIVKGSAASERGKVPPERLAVLVVELGCGFASTMPNAA